jgi:uncharacterized protein DUF4231
MTSVQITPIPEEPAQTNDLALDRLEDQLQWYERKSGTCQKWYTRLKTLTIVSASLIPILTGFSNGTFTRLLTSALAGLVAVIEGLQQLHQFHSNWISYRSTCEALKHEKYLYLASAGHYAGVANSRALLVERVESLVSQEQGQWSSNQSPAAPPGPQS